MENSQENKTGRYSVGETLYGIHFWIKNTGWTENLFPRLPYWSMCNREDVIEKISIVKLDVTEHHKVLSEYDKPESEKKCDGYLLADEEGQRWTNQYPRASYGQVSDSADRHFHIELPDGEEFAQYMQKRLAAGKPLCCNLLTDTCNTIRRGIDYYQNQEKTEYNDKQCRLLSDLLKRINDQLASDHGLVCEEYEHVIGDFKFMDSRIVPSLTERPPCTDA